MAWNFAVRVSIYYAALFGNLGFYLPFLPVWLAWRSMSPYEIGIITSVPLFVRIIATPVIGYWADTHVGQRRTIIVGGWIGFALAGLLSVIGGFWPLLVFVGGFQIAMQSIIPLAEAKALAGARHYGVDYGRMRLWGSAAFIAANLLGGVIIARFGGASVIAMVIASVFVMAVAAQFLPPDRTGDPVPGQGDISAAAGVPVWTMVSRPWFAALVIAAGLIQGSHAVFYAFGALHWRSLGIADQWIGVLWALGVIAEIGLFAVSGHVLARLGAVGLLLLGAAAAILRWVIMALDPAFWLLFPLQCLHALSFGATHLGTVNLIHAGFPSSRTGTAQSIHSALASGLVMGSVMFLAGLIFEPLGRLSFLVMAGLAALGMLASATLIWLQPSLNASTDRSQQ